MSSGAALDTVEAANADFPAVAKGMKDQSIVEKQETHTSTAEDLTGPDGEQLPTDEDWANLRRVYGKVNWMIYVIGIVEMCERFAYYGTTAVCMYPGYHVKDEEILTLQVVNFIQQELPTEGPFPSAGAAGTYGQAGALGMGQQASTGLVQFNQFFSYVMPMVGE